MAARQSHYHAVKDGSGKVLALYISRTPQQAMDEHTKPLTVERVSIEHATQLMTEGHKPVVVNGKDE